MMTCRPTRERACASARVDMERVRFVEVAYDDTWLRDSGPITLRAGDGFQLARFPLHRLGRQVRGQPGRPTGRGPRSMPESSSTVHGNAIDFALEGGAIETDGAGTLLTTWRCLHERHPELSIGRRWRDKLTRLAAAGPRALAGPRLSAKATTPTRTSTPSPALPAERRASCSRPATTLAIRTTASCSAWPRSWRRCAPPTASPIGCSRCRGRSPIVDEDRRLAASLRELPHRQWRRADARLWRSGRCEARRPCWPRHFPDREIVPVPCRPLIWQNGSLHCITMQLPQGIV